MTRLAETLTGERIHLRPPRTSDAEQLFQEVCGHPAVARYLTWRPHESAEDTERVLTSIMSANGARDAAEQTWIITADDLPVGMFSCWWEGDEVELGFCLGPSYWKRGLMREALGLVVGALTMDPTVTRIWASTDADNAASARTLHGAGLTQKALLPRHAIHPNIEPEPRDSLLFELGQVGPA